MKILTDENIGLEIVNFLRQKGHNVKSITETSPGISDPHVLRIAHREKRILITSDTDFGELIYRRKKSHAGVILLRLTDQTNTSKISVLQSTFQTHKKDIPDNFVVVTETNIRIRIPTTH